LTEHSVSQRRFDCALKTGRRQDGQSIGELKGAQSRHPKKQPVTVAKRDTPAARCFGKWAAPILLRRAWAGRQDSLSDITPIATGSLVIAGDVVRV
jgi:hypothetical protein